MNLTAFQKKNLDALLMQRREGLSVGRVILRNKAFQLVHALVAIGAIFYLTQDSTWHSIGCGLLGFAVGSYIRYLRTLIAMVQFWPVTSNIIDWGKAESF